MKIPAIQLNSLNSQRGSASILVIMLSLALIVFGVFSMMTAHAGLAVARRHGEWNAKFHQVESEAALIAAEVHHLTIDETAGIIHSVGDDVDLSDQRINMMKSIEKVTFEKQLPVTITKSDQSTETEELVFLAEINLWPTSEDRNGFYAALQYRVDLSNREDPRVSVDRIAWKSVTEDFEYQEGIEFRDVEVEVQVE